MQTRVLGAGKLAVSALGLGCMPMSQWYDPESPGEAVDTMRAAIDSGVTFFDTSDAYGPYLNEELLGRLTAPVRDRVVLATKFAVIYHGGGKRLGVDGSPLYVRQAVEASLRRLRTDRIDLYYLHRVDERTAIEDTVGAMAELVRQGKVLHLGLCEVSPPMLRRAHAVHPIAAVQSEYSLWSRDVELDGTLDAMRELGVGFVPYSPLGRGQLTGAIRAVEQLAPNDERRRRFPRFAPENFAANLAQADRLQALAAEHGASAAQLALAWVLARCEDFVPIPGTKRVAHLRENLAAVDLKPSAEVMSTLDSIFAPGAAAGARKDPGAMANLEAGLHGS